MRVLITGGLGFVGHHVVEAFLKKTDWDIVILDGLNYAGDINKITDITTYPQYKHRIWFVYHNLCSTISDIKHRQIGNIHYCIHLAAESHVENSLHDPIPFAYNVIATTNLLQYLKDKQPNLIKYIGFNTDEVFGPAPEGVYYKETDKFYPSNPYSASKGGQWCMEYAFWKSFRFPALMCHSMNIFGERQHPEKFIPKTIRAVLKGEKVPIHGIKDGNISSRCWIHAREVANGLLFLLDSGELGETYNVIGEEKSVLDLANAISKVINGKKLEDKQIEWIDYHTQRPGHDIRYALCGDKIKELGWKPSFTLDESLGKMVGWMILPENLKWLNL
jgi:dTDP-glucose 4,6-dehydratase